MRLIKRLNLYILKKFLPLFAMTFVIVLFIVLMQFLWKYIDDLVGKGLELSVLAELFFYAAVSMVPMALPLAILLAGLMTFGNLGEKSELTAIKAAGVSLLQVMRPLIVLVIFIAIAAFFFQNDVLPKAQVKMWTLLFSAKQKSPEVEIPEGAFYDQIPGFNLYVQEKNRQTGVLHKVMIYNVSQGTNDATILIADSAQLAFTKDMRYLYLHLVNGVEYGSLNGVRLLKNDPFERQSFADKEFLIPFDANFNKLDESGMRSQYVGKNMTELNQTIDSISQRVDSIGRDYANDLRQTAFPSLMRYDYLSSESPTNSTKSVKPALVSLDIDSVLNAMNPQDRVAVYSTATSIVRNRVAELEFRTLNISEEKRSIRRHQIELLKKFTLSIACLIFFFIGAPLGAIIRKGGLGTPIVISILLFLVYYIIDNTGYKMARDGRSAVWFGMWLSTMILFPFGIFVTYKAMNDSAVFNKDFYRMLIIRLLGLPEKRHLRKKEVIINEVNKVEATGRFAMLYALASSWRRKHRGFYGYSRFWNQGFSSKEIERIAVLANETVAYMSDSRNLYMIAGLERLPVVKPLWILHPIKSSRWCKVFKYCVPLGGLIYLCSLPYIRRIKKEMVACCKVALYELSLLQGFSPEKMSKP